MTADRTQELPAEDIAEEARVEATTKSNVRRGLGAMLIAVVFLALFNSAGFTVYARDLPGNEFSDQVVAIADWWHERMTDVGLARVIEEIREVFLSLKETEW